MTVTTKCVHFAVTVTIVTRKFCHGIPSYRCLSEVDQSPFTRTSNGAGALWLTSQVTGLLCLSRCSLRRRRTREFLAKAERLCTTHDYSPPGNHRASRHLALTRNAISWNCPSPVLSPVTNFQPRRSAIAQVVSSTLHGADSSAFCRRRPGASSRRCSCVPTLPQGWRMQVQTNGCGVSL